MMRIGFVGIGKMGLPMARRLAEKGYPLTLLDIREEAIQSLSKHVFKVAKSPAEMASEVETVLVSLPTPEIVQEVAVGEQGLIHGNKIRIYIDLSTTGPQVAEGVAKRLNEKGIHALDAPVSGGVSGAEKGSLTVMVSGPLAVFEEIRPILEIIGENVFYIGKKFGMGQMMKLLNNLLSATALAASSEAFVLGVKAGLDPKTMLRVINSSSGRNGATEDKFPKSILPRTFDWGFKTDLIYKDMKLCLEEGERLGVPMWVGNAVRQLWAYVISQGGGPRDYTTIIQYIEAWAGVEVQKCNMDT